MDPQRVHWCHRLQPKEATRELLEPGEAQLTDPSARCQNHWLEQMGLQGVHWCRRSQLKGVKRDPLEPVEAQMTDLSARYQNHWLEQMGPQEEHLGHRSHLKEAEAQVTGPSTQWQRCRLVEMARWEARCCLRSQLERVL
jgi:hypothetical protein